MARAATLMGPSGVAAMTAAMTVTSAVAGSWLAAAVGAGMPVATMGVLAPLPLRVAGLVARVEMVRRTASAPVGVHRSPLLA